MKTIMGQVMTSEGTDLQGDIITEEEIRIIFDKIPETVILNQEHDNTKLPPGIAYNKRLEKLNDGKLAIKMDIDLYDDAIEIDFKGVSITFRRYKIEDTFKENPDINFRYNPRNIDRYYLSSIKNLSSNELKIGFCEVEEKGMLETVIIVVTFASSYIAKGFFENIGADIYKKLKSNIYNTGVKFKDEKNKTLVYHFKFQFDFNSQPVEIYVKCPYTSLELILQNGLDTDTIMNFLKEYLGNSFVMRVIIEPCNEKPYWKIIHIIDSEGKAIELE
ncbi:MAG: hypothetical protein ABIJ12_04050 [bacterium]